MPLVVDMDRLATILDAGIADADRTLEQKSPPGVRYRVLSLVVEELRYDEDADLLIESGEIAIRNKDGEWCTPQ